MKLHTHNEKSTGKKRQTGVQAKIYGMEHAFPHGNMQGVTVAAAQKRKFGCPAPNPAAKFPRPPLGLSIRPKLRP